MLKYFRKPHLTVELGDVFKLSHGFFQRLILLVQNLKIFPQLNHLKKNIFKKMERSKKTPK